MTIPPNLIDDLVNTQNNEVKNVPLVRRVNYEFLNLLNEDDGYKSKIREWLKCAPTWKESTILRRKGKR